MDIQLNSEGKSYVVKHFPDLSVLGKAFATIEVLQSPFDRAQVEQACPRLTSEQLIIVIDLLLYAHDNEAYDLWHKSALLVSHQGFVVSPAYESIANEILLTLSIKDLPSNVALKLI